MLIQKNHFQCETESRSRPFLELKPDFVPRLSVPWTRTIRAVESYPLVGIERVEAISPDMTGIRFRDGMPPTIREKEMMQVEAQLFYKPNVKAWLKRADPMSRDETQALARWIAEERRKAQREEP